MKLLLDTHVWLWFVRGEATLPRAFDAAIRDPENAVVLSIVSAWEVQIKAAIGKLQIGSPTGEFLDNAILHFDMLDVLDAARPRAHDASAASSRSVRSDARRTGAGRRTHDHDGRPDGSSVWGCVSAGDAVRRGGRERLPSPGGSGAARRLRDLRLLRSSVGRRRAQSSSTSALSPALSPRSPSALHFL
jgi:hypothetical protein